MQGILILAPVLIVYGEIKRVGYEHGTGPESRSELPEDLSWLELFSQLEDLGSDADTDSLPNNGLEGQLN